MEQNVYVDLLFLINFSMDYLCLYICARIMHRRIILPKLLLAASLGGIHSVCALFINAASLPSLIIDVGICMIMCAIVFSEKGRPLSSTLLCTFLFVGISMMTGGIMTAIFNLLNRLNLPLGEIEDDGISTYLFAAIAAVSGLVALRSGKVISRRASFEECSVIVTIESKSITLPALSDSGNLVKDPLTGKPVILIDRKALAKIIDLSLFDRYLGGDLSPPEFPHGLRLIPINTAGGKSLIVAATPDKLTIKMDRSSKKPLVFDSDALISPSDIGNSAEGYQAIVPAEILKP